MYKKILILLFKSFILIYYVLYILNFIYQLFVLFIYYLYIIYISLYKYNLHLFKLSFQFRTVALSRPVIIRLIFAE